MRLVGVESDLSWAVSCVKAAAVMVMVGKGGREGISYLLRQGGKGPGRSAHHVGDEHSATQPSYITNQSHIHHQLHTQPILICM